MARKKRQVKKSRSRRKRYSSSEESDSESDSDLNISSDSSSSSSESEDDSSSSEESDVEADDFDESQFFEENRRNIEDDVRELLKDAKLMKYEDAIIDQLDISTYSSMKNCDDKQLKRIKMGYSERERLLNAFRNHIEGILDKGREKWERQQELKHSKRTKKKRGKSKSSKSSKSRKKKSSKSSSKSKKKSKSKGKSRRSGRSKNKIDPDEALKKLETGWSGKRQAWADYKQHEARVAELVEFYDEIGKKRTNPEEHARKLILEYPGGIHKLVTALDKKYHHIPYGWEELLEEAERYREAEGETSD